MGIFLDGNDIGTAYSVAPDTVGTVEIVDGEVMSIDLANGAVTGAKLALGSVTDDKISGPISISKLDTDPLARANHTGTQLLSTISDAGSAAANDTGDFATAVHSHTLSDVTDSGTSAALDVPSSGDAASGEVVKGDDTRLTDSRGPNGGAGGDLSGSYPNPTVVDDSHAHTLSTISDSGTMAAETAADYLLLAGGTMTGSLNMGSQSISSVSSVTSSGFVTSGNGFLNSGFGTTNSQWAQSGLATDSYYRFSVKRYGDMNWGDGTFSLGSASSPSLSFLSANTLALGSSDHLRVPAVPTHDDDVANKKFVEDTIIFGDEYQFSRDDTTTTTSNGSGSPVEHHRITTGSLPAGTYLVQAGAAFRTSNSNAEIHIGIHQDPDGVGTALDYFDGATGTTNASDRYHVHFAEEVVLAAGSEVFSVEFFKQFGSGTVTIEHSKLMIWRVA